MPPEGEEIPYKQFAALVQRTNQACRLIIHHINKDLRKGAVSLKEALSGKTLPSQIALAKRRKAAAERKACSPKDASAVKPLPAQVSKPQKQVSAEKRTLSPKDAVPEMPMSYQACESQKQALAEKRAFSPEDGPDVKPLPSQSCKLQEQAPAESRASSPGDAVDEKPPCDQASKPQQQIPHEQASRFRLENGARVPLRPAPDVMFAADALLELAQAGSWGQLSAADCSAGLQRLMELHNIKRDQD